MGSRKRVAWYLGKTDEIIEMDANTSYSLIILIIQRTLWLEEMELMYLGAI